MRDTSYRDRRFCLERKYRNYRQEIRRVAQVKVAPFQLGYFLDYCFALPFVDFYRAAHQLQYVDYLRVPLRQCKIEALYFQLFADKRAGSKYQSGGRKV